MGSTAPGLGRIRVKIRGPLHLSPHQRHLVHAAFYSLLRKLLGEEVSQRWHQGFFPRSKGFALSPLLDGTGPPAGAIPKGKGGMATLNAPLFYLSTPFLEALEQAEEVLTRAKEQGLLLRFGQASAPILGVERLPLPPLSEGSWVWALSPIEVHLPQGKKGFHYMAPEEEGFRATLKANLQAKVRLLGMDPEGVDIAFLPPLSKRVVHHKGKPIVGWKGRFYIWGVSGLLAALTLGLGSKNALGFGFVATEGELGGL